MVVVAFVAAGCAVPPTPSGPVATAASPSPGRTADASATATISTNRVTTVVAGTGTIGRSGDGGPAIDAGIEYPVGITGHDGALLFAEATANRIRQVTPDGIIGTVAGTTVAGWSGDGSPAIKARLASPTDVAFDARGNLYIVDEDNQRLRQVDTAGVISTVAGTGEMGHTGDGGPAVDAALDSPMGVIVDRDGDILVTEEAGTIRRIRPNGVIDTIAGGGTDLPGDGGAATEANLRDLTGITIDDAGTIFVADFLDCRVRSITRQGTIATVAGDGSCNHAGDEGSAVDAGLRYPVDVAVGRDQDLYILEHIDPDSGYVRRVDASGTIHAVALDVALREPMGLAVVGDRLFISNRDAARIISIGLP